MAEQFLAEHHALNSISPERRHRQKQEILGFEAFAGKPIEDTRAPDFKAYVLDLVGRGLHPNTVRFRANLIRPFYGWALDNELIDDIDFFRLKRIRNPRGASSHSTPKPYSRAEVNSMWRALDTKYPTLPAPDRPGWKTTDGRWNIDLYIKRWQRDQMRFFKLRRHFMNLQMRAIAHLALHAGMRRGEIAAASFDSIHYDNAYVVIHGAAKNHAGVGRDREVPMTKSLAEALQAWMEVRVWVPTSNPSPWLMPYPHLWDTPPTTKSLEHWWGIERGIGYELHRLRHTCGTQWLRAGLPIEQVQKLLGHASIHQTLGYAQLVRTDLERGMGKAVAEFEASLAAE